MLKMATTSGKQTTITFKREDETEVKYLLQHPGVRRALEIQGSFFDAESGKIDMNIKREALMKNVIFKEDMKRTSWEYWEEVGMEEAEFVFKEADKFLSGKNTN